MNKDGLQTSTMTKGTEEKCTKKKLVTTKTNWFSCGRNCRCQRDSGKVKRWTSLSVTLKISRGGVLSWLMSRGEINYLYYKESTQKTNNVNGQRHLLFFANILPICRNYFLKISFGNILFLLRYLIRAIAISLYSLGNNFLIKKQSLGVINVK